MTQAFLSKGIQVQVETSPGSAVYATIPEITSLTGPGLEDSEVDVFNMDSPGRSREYIPGPVDPGSFQFEVNYIPGDTQHEQILSDLSSQAQTSRSFRIRFAQLSPVRRWDFTGFYRQFSGSFDPATQGRISGAIRISGSITPVEE